MLWMLLACGHSMDCDEARAYFGKDEQWAADIDAADSDITVDDCVDTDPDIVDVTHAWWRVCGDYYDAREKVIECCPEGIGYPRQDPNCPNVSLP